MAEKLNEFFAAVFTAEELKTSSLPNPFYKESVRTVSHQSVHRKYFKTNWLMNKNNLPGTRWNSSKQKLLSTYATGV